MGFTLTGVNGPLDWFRLTGVNGPVDWFRLIGVNGPLDSLRGAPMNESIEEIGLFLTQEAVKSRQLYPFYIFTLIRE